MPTDPKRRGTATSPPNRFVPFHLEPDPEVNAEFEDDRTLPGASGGPAELTVLPTELFEDLSRSVVTENDSPDVSFRYSLNPYRGCEHGCTYCYARPFHEMLGWNAGIDFETKILVKRDAPTLLRQFLCKPGWRGEPIAFSGVTDPYQPIERRLGITRGCMEILLEARQPVQLVTKGWCVTRDLDLLGELAAKNLVQAAVAVTTLKPELARSMEPRATLPERRLEIIRRLTDAGVPVMLLLAPTIPGLTDVEIPRILEAARMAGAVAVRHVLLRLPHSVETIFFDWVDRELPLARRRIEESIRRVRDGKLNEERFKERMRGTGPAADRIRSLIEVFAQRHGYARDLPPLDCSQFRPPDGQLRLFD